MSIRLVHHLNVVTERLEETRRFYVDVLGLRRALDVGYGRITIDAASGFTIASTAT